MATGADAACSGCCVQAEGTLEIVFKWDRQEVTLPARSTACESRMRLSKSFGDKGGWPWCKELGQTSTSTATVDDPTVTSRLARMNLVEMPAQQAKSSANLTMNAALRSDPSAPIVVISWSRINFNETAPIAASPLERLCSEGTGAWAADDGLLPKRDVGDDCGVIRSRNRCRFSEVRAKKDVRKSAASDGPCAFTFPQT